jgi:uncharacterized protein YbaP (TraB family)
MNRYRPWFMALMITSMEYAALGAKPDKGVDTHFEERAKKDGKPGIGLETVEFQIQLFASLSDKQQNELLDQTLAEISSVDRIRKAAQSLETRRSGNAARHALQRGREVPRPHEPLPHRPEPGVDGPARQMLKYGEKVMVLVGTGHLTSDTGLIELLRKRGHRVRHYSEVTDF